MPQTYSGRRQVAHEELDPLAERLAQEHERFLEEHNPSVLRGQSDRTSYLSSVGQQAADQVRFLVSQYRRTPEFKNLPHHRQVLALQSRRHEAEELVRDEILHQPRSEPD
jgi:hypothetical protein